MRKIDINTADKHIAVYHHIFIWTMVVKHQTKRKMMLNDVFICPVLNTQEPESRF